MMNRKIAAFFALCLLTFASVAQAQTNTVRAIWTPDNFVIINISQDGVDLSELSLHTPNGAITPDQWVMHTDDAGVSYPLTDVRPGSCLVAAFSGTTPVLPDTVTCTRIIAETTLTNLGDIVWGIEQPHFTPRLATTDGAACDTHNRTSCDIAVNAANTNPSAATTPENVAIRAIWNNDAFVLINTSKYGVNLVDLTLTSDTGSIEPSHWVMHINEETTASYNLRNLRPGSCLVAYLSVQGTDAAAPSLPEAVTCTRIAGVHTPENLDDLVWVYEGNGFTPSVGGVSGEKCDIISRTACVITVPNADVDGASTDDTTADNTSNGQSVRAIWTNDIFVLINTSDSGADFSQLTLTGTNGGAILPENWVLAVDGAGVSYALNDARPGACLIAYLSVDGTDTPAPSLPQNVSCTNIIGTFQQVNPSDQIWTLESNGFTPSVAGVAGEKCEIIGTTSCDIALN